MPRVSATDWLNCQRADRLISAVLIGQHHGSHHRPHRTFNEPYTQRTHIRTHDAQIDTPTHNVHAQQSNIGNTRSPVTTLYVQYCIYSYFIYMQVCICMYVCVFVCIYIYVCVCICMCGCVCTDTYMIHICILKK